MTSTASKQNHQDDVNDTLTATPRAGGGSTNQAHTTRRGRGGAVENTDYAAFATRVIRAHARRVAAGDIDALVDLLKLASEVDAATDTAVQGLREFGYSWGEIADRIGITRQAAHQRWATP
jgi:hypothetical protein